MSLVSLMTDPVRRARLGAAARALVEANRGAKDKTLAVLSRAAAAGSTTTFRPTSGRSDPLLDLLYAQAVARRAGAGSSATRTPDAGCGSRSSASAT